MEREIGIDQLVAAMKAVDEAGRLFEESLAVYEARGLKRTGGDFTVAGGSVQTLQGAEEMALGARRFLTELAVLAGFTAAGLEERPAGRAHTLRAGFPGVAVGGSRMARPLLEPTLKGLRLLLDADLFTPAFKAEVEEVLRAEAATYPAPSAPRVPRAAAARTP
ncbi:hypothetical protein [Streptomyces subrutilus]|uniref:Uncharacterized protein n=1 Tax=Streptomyces subrutilus TaxID=36818 RepID=A0A1E5PM63_9ACTN|nr:hypothetical protein [Streptomyces subrutilus]OEJ30614.1 hypothetical protein BGK67_03955 [Streptomyces subrutilus]